jgi:hypothetical protein
MIDWSVSVGNILTLAGFAFGGISFVVAVRRDVSVLAARLGPIESAVVKMTEILERLGRQDERLKAVERDVERNDLRKQRR